jgi:hypothetical protein
LAYQEVPKYSDFNFTFPFAIEYDPNKDYDQTVLNDIAEKCGLTGAEKQPINLFYDIKLTAQVLFIKVHPTISSSTTFDCPLNVCIGMEEEYYLYLFSLTVFSPFFRMVHWMVSERIHHQRL